MADHKILRNVGTKMEHDGEENYMYYPHIRFTLEQLPEIATWMVGGDYDLRIRVREISHQISEHGGEQKESAEFEITAVAAIELSEKDKVILDRLGVK